MKKIVFLLTLLGIISMPAFSEDTEAVSQLNTKLSITGGIGLDCGTDLDLGIMTLSYFSGPSYAGITSAEEGPQSDDEGTIGRLDDPSWYGHYGNCKISAVTGAQVGIFYAASGDALAGDTQRVGNVITLHKDGDPTNSTDATLQVQLVWLYPDLTKVEAVDGEDAGGTVAHASADGSPIVDMTNENANVYKLKADEVDFQVDGTTNHEDDASQNYNFSGTVSSGSYSGKVSMMVEYY